MLTKNKTFKYVIIGIVLLAGVLAWLFATSSTKNVPRAVPQVAPHEIKNTNLQEEQNGKLVWKLDIDSLIYDKSQDANILKGIKGIFYQEDGSSITITAADGAVYMKNKTIVLTGDPRGEVSTGGVLTADKLTWLNDKKFIVAEGKVKIVKDDAVATADKGTMDTVINKIKLEGKALVRKGVEG